jgi:serine/threonine protein kinase
VESLARPLTGLRPGVHLGRYELLQQLAIGGMAEVYLARVNGIEGFRKRVVLKRILPQYASDPAYVSMFLDEARLAARLHHANIVQVFDVGAAVGDYFIAMEYVAGKDVRAILSAAARQERAIPLGVALSIAQGICRGLHFAHDLTDDDGRPLGIVHRDVTPANAIVTYDGCTKVLDFGVAKATTQTRETQSGTLKGKIGYMSPEQCQGEALDRRSDVFAIGILLFELTTGTRLYNDDAELKMLMRIVQEDAPLPSSRRNDYPPELEFIVRRALARDREVRYATARDVERDLAAFARAADLDDSQAGVADFLRELFPGAGTAFEPELGRSARGTGRDHADDGDDPSIVVLPHDAVNIPPETLDDEVADGDIEIDVVESSRLLTPPVLFSRPAGAATSRPATRRRSFGRALVAVAGVLAISGGALYARDAGGVHGEARAVADVPAAPTEAAPAAAAPDAVDDEAAPAAPTVAAAPTEAAPASEPELLPRASATADAKADKIDEAAPERHRRSSSRRRARGSSTEPKPKPKPSEKATWNPDSALLPGL